MNPTTTGDSGMSAMGMRHSGTPDIVKLEMAVRLLRERERGLRYLAQSRCCSLRPEAEVELGKVRAEILSTFEQIRHLHPNA